MNIKKWWRSTAASSPVWKYHLDYPSTEHGQPKEKTGWVVQGWVLVKPQVYRDLKQPPYLSVKLNEQLERCIPLDRNRPDVVSTFKHAQAQEQCGFRLALPLSGTKLQLRLHINDQSYALIDLSLPVATPENDAEPEPLKVLQGHQDWLFLDNDTNFSVDQHRGLLRLSKKCLADWQRYIQDWQTHMAVWDNRALFLIAPTKESVLSHYYPYQAAASGLFDEVFAQMPSDMYLYPTQELQALGDASYYKTDTHWTHQGAQRVVESVAQRLGLDGCEVQAVFVQDTYQTREHVGDLGNKLTPPFSQPASFLTGMHYKKWVVFDNALPNFGRVVLMQNHNALYDALCLVFGSSSSYSLLSYLCRIFQRVLVAHTAGHIDLAMLNATQPTYVIAQTNARFMVRPPTFEHSVSATVKQKSRALTTEQKEALTVIEKPEGSELIAQLGLDLYLPVL